MSQLQEIVRAEVSGRAADAFPAWFLGQVMAALKRCPELDDARLAAFCRAKAFAYVAIELDRLHGVPD